VDALIWGGLEEVLRMLPIDFFTVEDNVREEISYSQAEQGVMDVYHDTLVVEIYPPTGRRLSNSSMIDMDFPIRPDNIMDDQCGLRCCFHPKFSSFGMAFPSGLKVHEFEIDIHKFPRDNAYGR